MKVNLKNEEERMDFFRDIARKNLFEFWTKRYGYRLVVDEECRDYFVGQGTYDTDEVASVDCPGIGNLDSTYFCDGFCEWDEEKEAYVSIEDGRIIGDFKAVIQECIDFGDVEDDIEELAQQLEKSYTKE